MATPKNTAAPTVLSDDELAAARLATTVEQFPEIQSVDPNAVIERMVKRVRSAGTIDDLFDALTGTSSDQMLGRSFEFTDVTWQPYLSDRGTIPLAVCDVVDLSTGESTEFVTTATMLVHFLRQAQILGAYPFKARVVGKKTNSGQTALNFERI